MEKQDQHWFIPKEEFFEISEIRRLEEVFRTARFTTAEYEKPDEKGQLHRQKTRSAVLRGRFVQHWLALTDANPELKLWLKGKSSITLYTRVTSTTIRSQKIFC